MPWWNQLVKTGSKNRPKLTDEQVMENIRHKAAAADTSGMGKATFGNGASTEGIRVAYTTNTGDE